MVNSPTSNAISTERRGELLAALADPHRLEILSIRAADVHCNCHLQDLLDLAPNLLSYHWTE